MSARIIGIESTKNSSIKIPAHVTPTSAFPVVDSYMLTGNPSHSNELPDKCRNGTKTIREM